jgi:pimeloyl-ACP methyl ester carboxylesterase
VGGTAAKLARRGWYAVTIDQRGHGDSQWSPEGDYALDHYAADLRAVCTQLAAPPAIVGASLGGMAGLLALGEAADGRRRARSCSSTSRRASRWRASGASSRS